MVPISNHDSAGRWKDLNQGRFRKRALFKQSRRLLRLKADTSRIEACWYCTNNIKYATLFYQDNHSTTIHSGPVFKGRIFVYLLMQGDRFVIDECVNQWSFGQRILVWCDRRQKFRYWQPPELGSITEDIPKPFFSIQSKLSPEILIKWNVPDHVAWLKLISY